MLTPHVLAVKVNQQTIYIHMFWSCPKHYTLWASIFGAYSEMLQRVITPNSVCALFGLTPENRFLIAFSSLIARRLCLTLILLSWKNQAPPNFTRWIRDVMHFLKLEKIQYTLKGAAKM